MTNDELKEVELDNNAISLAGEFAVLSQLVLRGYDANMTLGRTKSVDILASDPTHNRMFKIEVKTHYRNTPTKSALFGHALEWVMSKKHEDIIDPNLYYCFVNIEKEKHNFRFFIVPSGIVARYVKEQHEYWISTRQYEPQETIMRRFRLGLDTDGYSIPTPIAYEYENKWDFE